MLMVNKQSLSNPTPALLDYIRMISIEFEFQESDILHKKYRKASNIRHTSVGNKIIDHLDVVGESPVGAAPNTSSF